MFMPAYHPQVLPDPDPDLFATSFRSNVAGQAPHDWSTLWRSDGTAEVVVDETSPTGRTLELVGPAATARHGFVWDTVGEVSGDVEVLALVRQPVLTGGNLCAVALHMSGAVGAEQNYHVSLYGASVETTGILAYRYVSGSGSVIFANLSTGWDLDVWYYIRLRREGNGLYARFWEYGEDEPDGFLSDPSETDLSTGRVGLWFVNESYPFHVAFFSVAKGGKTAPTFEEL